MSAVRRSKRKSGNSDPDFKEHKKYLLAMDHEKLVDILEAAWNNKNSNVQECMSKKIIELKKVDWFKVDEQREMFETNWIIENNDNDVKIQVMSLSFKEDKIKLGYFEKLEKFKKRNGVWNQDGELVFTVNGGGCQEDDDSNEGFTLILEESYDKLTRRLRVEQNVECHCDGELNEKADENTFLAYPE